MYKQVFKSIIDAVAACTGLLLLAPLLLIVMILLTIVNKGNPFFTQNRPGKNGKTFQLIKFCSMRNTVNERGELLPDKERITKVGQFVRSASLDELPQLINVLKGDMSLVGPRPLLMNYMPLYSTEQNRRHEVKPGITGWAQVNGRNALSWNEKFLLDVYYVDNLSFATDIKIIMLTFEKIIKREGINASEQTTMSSFKGN
jgi:lipopolysaccharide/colanic/teichoic acid biosynthesis glycosyltransferase